ncbi:MAG: type II secretion system F family protein [Acidobacteriaceae bacterium]
MTLLLIFAGIALFSFAVIALLTRPSAEEKTIHKRLQQATHSGAGAQQAGDEVDELLKQPLAAGSVAHLDRILDGFDFYPRLEKLIEQAHRPVTPARVLLQAALTAAGGALAARLLYPHLIVEVAAPIAGLASPFALLLFQRKRRVKQFNDALPDAIDLMSRALKAGHSVSSAIEVVAEQGREPVASEFREVFRAQNFGLPYRDALIQLADRVPSADLRFLITAMMVQKETGGNLTEILDRTTYVIRERLRIYGEVRTKTAQGRLTGMILAALPIILGVIINIINPGYAKPLIATPIGHKLLIAGAGLITIGTLIIQRIVKIEV